jgi:glycosyltransferase involved in cell wall biosynthesis
VIPTHDRAALLADTLERCLEHAADLDLELVVVDDGSRDDTAERLEDLAKRIPELVWRSVPNGGPGQARNLGASLASREVVLFLGDDIQPASADFFRVHAELHAQHPERELAVLGKVVWPNLRDGGVNFVMAHVQGRGGEQFGYADLHPYSFLDWRFFYTANVSVKRRLLDDWTREGFHPAFSLAAFEDAEFAFRMMRRDPPLRLLYAPASVGTHHHSFSVGDFLSRQLAAGMMARVFSELHPGNPVRDMIGLGGISHALRKPRDPRLEEALADSLSVVEGIKSWARLIESQMQLGSQSWHDDLLKAVFHLGYLQGYVIGGSEPDENAAAAYRFLLDEFALHMTRVFHSELAGAALRRRDVANVLALAGEEVISRSLLRRWAREQPWIARPVRWLRRRLG